MGPVQSDAVGSPAACLAVDRSHLSGLLKRRSLWLLGLALVCTAGTGAEIKHVRAASPEAFASAGLPLVLSADVRELLAWLDRTGNHRGLPVVVVDKRAALLWLFNGRLDKLGGTPVLLGLAHGDESVPGIGTKPLAEVAVTERTTPAGRFLVEPGINIHGEDIFWVDYDNAVSMHRLRAVNPAERRAQRMASPRAADHRITYGCINVPPTFYNRVLQPVLLEREALVYVLPEAMPLQRWLERLEPPGTALNTPGPTGAALNTP